MKNLMLVVSHIPIFCVWTGIWISVTVSVGSEHLLGADRHSVVHSVEGEESTPTVLALNPPGVTTHLYSD